MSTSIMPRSSLNQYLSPEPLLQYPDWVRREASKGFSTPTYAYARNNPLKYTDPTGLFSWRHDCSPSPLHGGSRGFVASTDNVFGPRIYRYGGAVGFDNPYNTACEDLAWLDAYTRNASASELGGDYVAFVEAGDCWSELREEIANACRRERQHQAPACIVPPDPNPNPQPRRPLGG